jgi:CRP/FNR family cyclic AMP-dependent transcriptional regulator
MQEYWFLPPSDFLGNLPQEDREALLAFGQSRDYPKGAYVFRSGAPGLNVYFLEAGRAKIYKLSDSGREVIQWFCFPGELFGLAEVSRGGSREVFAQVCTASRVHCIPRGDFTRFLGQRPEVALQVIDLLSCRLRVLGDMFMNLASDDVTSRIVKLILRLCARYGREQRADLYLDIPLTHQEIADMVGTTRQTVTTILNKLKRDGILRVEKHCIHIESQDLLASMAEHL